MAGLTWRTIAAMVRLVSWVLAASSPSRSYADLGRRAPRVRARAGGGKTDVPADGPLLAVAHDVPQRVDPQALVEGGNAPADQVARVERHEAEVLFGCPAPPACWCAGCLRFRPSAGNG